ncbi:hypothetical protein AZL_a01550 (plasmid) [Azospirillum sp. B510]|uniref:helix-turn-helix domain-containing protein n=1 Tax=Azospirillum sp. (strain B510) TaxID=137722 RepID=UPI0001C4B8E6|nr:helix-turn-helix domain-containing protein [Azospirillum sp. B510]BAI73686.1 hypothetical protein AZL_a01550 [Azospirillum sp. B510]
MSDRKFKELIVLSSADQAGDVGRRLPNQPPAPRDEMDRQKLAERLREQGWSYRRISEELQVSYVLVARWLGDGPVPQAARVASPSKTTSIPAETPVPAPKGKAAKAAATRTAAADDDRDVLALQFQAFEQYVRDVIATLDERHEAMMSRQDELIRALDEERGNARAREEELLGALETERARWSEAEERFRTELEQFKEEMRASGGLPGKNSGEDTADDDPFGFSDDAEEKGGKDPFDSDDGESGMDPFSFDDEEAQEASAENPFGFDNPVDAFNTEKDSSETEQAVTGGAGDPEDGTAEDEDPFKGFDDEPADDETSAVSADAFSFDDEEPAVKEPEPEPDPPKKRKGLMFWRRG